MSNNTVKKAEYDFVPTIALSVVVIALIAITIAAVIFIWSVLNKASTDAILAKRGQALATVVRVNGDESKIFNVLDFRKNDARLVLQGGVTKVGKNKVSVQPIGKAMQRLVANPSFLTVLPKPAKTKQAPAPRRAAPKKAPAPRRAAPVKKAPAKPAAPAPVKKAPAKPAAPVKKPAAPVKKPAAPVKKPAAPAPAPVKKAPAKPAAPVKKAPTPAKKAAPAPAPVKKAPASQPAAPAPRR